MGNKNTSDKNAKAETPRRRGIFLSRQGGDSPRDREAMAARDAHNAAQQPDPKLAAQRRQSATDHGGYPLGSRTTRPHDPDGWSSSR